MSTPSPYHRPKTVAEAFNPRSNSIGFLRWLMAFLVIFSHAGPVGGFYGGEDLGIQLSSEQSLGGVAVAGFFFFSGFLITKSRMGRSSIFRYFWRRALRIMPAYWTAMLTTVCFLAPVAWFATRGEIDGYLHPEKETPLTYFFNNMFLELGQRNIAGMGEGLPYGLLHNNADWNGSAWTLKYEFICYIVVGILGLMGFLANRWLGVITSIAFMGLNALQWMSAGNMVLVSPFFSDIYLLMFMGPFFFGVIFSLAGDKIPMDDRLAVSAIVIAFITYDMGGWNIFGQYFFMYFLMWLAVRLPLTNWEKYGDFSYGIYIFSWPLMTFYAHFGLQNLGWLPYHATIVLSAHVMAFLSWHLIEKPAMSFKNANPRWMMWLIDKGRPLYNRVRDIIVTPAFSSTRYAQTLELARIEQEKTIDEGGKAKTAAQEESATGGPPGQHPSGQPLSGPNSPEAPEEKKP
ncbi:MAG: acyltransferase [Actinomycetaceae bacterium]|nr:acyltransferase [Actinomycetaceae bacterium]